MIWLYDLLFGYFGRKVAGYKIFSGGIKCQKNHKPSPYQVRKYFDEDKKKGLAQSIQRNGLIQPIVVRLNNGHPEIIAGERRVQAIRDYTGIKSVPARIVEASDLQARRIAAAENFQREDLTAIEEVEAIVELVDAELIEDIVASRPR